jgi:hypothetical protein
MVAHPASSGEVLASLPGTIYMRDGNGKIWWVSADTFPMHRRCLRVSLLPSPPRVRSGETWFVKNAALRIGDSLSIDLGPLKEWIPRPVLSERPQPLKEVKGRCDRLLRFIRDLGPLEGLGRFIPLISKGGDGKEVLFPSLDFVSRRFLPLLLEMRKACLLRDMAETLEKGKGLIGLGPGLTPSGDDFLGGLLFAARNLKETYPEVFFWNPDRILDFVAWARPRTHPISHAFLNDFALGHGPAHLHEVMNFLIPGNDFEKAVSAADQFLRIGHSSGGDILAGLMTGMLMVFEMQAVENH